MFDEPDANIHEARKFDLYKLLKKYNNRQTIITSHSPSLVKNADSNELKYLENRNGKTEIIAEEKIEYEAYDENGNLINESSSTDSGYEYFAIRNE